MRTHLKKLGVPAAAAVAFSLLSHAAAAAYEESEFRFEVGGHEIVGTLAAPADRGPHPAVVLVAGSGAVDRNDGQLQKMRRFFAEIGCIAVSWDKPGVGASAGDWSSQSMADRASEASGALAALARRSDVDPRTLGAWGISQAGWVLPRVRGPQGEPLAFIVGVSLPGGTPDAQDRFRTDSLGFDAREQREANRWARRRVAMMQQAVPWSVFAREQGGLHERPWLRQLGELDEKSFTFASRLVRDHPTLERIDSPTLLFLGGNDKLVDIEDSASAFVRAARRGHVPLTIRVIPDADHGLGVPSGADTGYTRTIRTWLSDLLHRQL